MQETSIARTLELPDELADALSEEASRLGLSLPDYAIRLLTSARPLTDSVQNGRDLVDYWNSKGVIGSRQDQMDSQAEALLQRNQAQRRGA